MADALLGSRITLLSNLEVRYEGTLHGINPVEQTLTLADVQFHGTEGRNAALGKPEIPPSPARYPFIVFNAKDIKDLQVTQRAAEVPQPPPIHDPAVLATPAVLPTAAAPAAAAPAAAPGASASHSQRQPRPQQHQHHTRAPVRGPELDLQTEFDFESSNAKLASLRLGGEDESSQAAAASEAPKAYDKKSSFFDNISSDIKDRAEGKRANFNPREARQAEGRTNLETFGQAFSHNRGGHRGRGRGRGGRGGHQDQRQYDDRRQSGRGGAQSGSHYHRNYQGKQNYPPRQNQHNQQHQHQHQHKQHGEDAAASS